jgi:MGT family glycosyltransferase
LGSVLGELPDAVAAYRAILDAVADLPARVLFTIGRAIEPDGLGAPPPHVHIEPWVPQEQVLPAADVVVAHGGSGTTFGALAAGVPLVLVPFFADQPVNSDRVAAMGAAIVVASDAAPHPTRAVTRPDPLRLRAAIESVLGDTSYRRAASRIADEMRALPSVNEVVDALARDPRHT